MMSVALKNLKSSVEIEKAHKEVASDKKIE
jgi:hypothetical protein